MWAINTATRRTFCVHVDLAQAKRTYNLRKVSPHVWESQNSSIVVYTDFGVYVTQCAMRRIVPASLK